jgi:hypothetical protein
MRRDRGESAIERRHRVVAEQEAKPRIEAGGALGVERAEAIEPGRRARPRSDADLEREDLGRKLAALVEIDEQRPEVGDGVRDGAAVVRVRASRRQRLLEAAAGRGFPVGDALP